MNRKEYSRKWYLANKEIVAIKSKQYYLENAEYIKKRTTAWRAANKEKRNTHERQKRKTNLNFRLKANLRNRIKKAIKENWKSGSAVKNLGCSIDELKIHLESKFYTNPITKEKMTWNNYGIRGWHVDHVIPLVNFDLTVSEQFAKAVHYTNLQPLWYEENTRKQK